MKKEAKRVLRTVYLDNSATTRVCPEAAEAALQTMTEIYGNPSSLHSMGFAAEMVLKETREAVASLLSVPSAEVFFTSGGTEANNIALFGAAQAGRRNGARIVTTAIEHPSVLRVMDELKQHGFTVVTLAPDCLGRIDPEQIRQAVTPDTILVSMMAVNNEVGTILPVQAAAEAIRRSGSRALLHVDAVQAFGKIPLHPKKQGIDLMTVSAHKLHGPKGVGALYCSNKVRLRPRVFGGGQERGLRSGTEAVPAIAGFGAAVRALPEMAQTLAEITRLNRKCREGLFGMPGAIVQSPEDALPYVLNVSLPGIRSEVMLHFLSGKGIFVSSGSACAGKEKSHVLRAMGLPERQVDASLRISFSRDSTEADVDALLDGLREGAKTLIKSRTAGRNR